jgi:hypothetical protein
LLQRQVKYAKKIGAVRVVKIKKQKKIKKIKILKREETTNDSTIQNAK